MGKENVIAALEEHFAGVGIPTSEFSAQFVLAMMGQMQNSFHKYGRVAQAYPDRFDALSDIRTRLSKFRETGDFRYLVDVANFAMIETMHPNPDRAAPGHWTDDVDGSSPGRNLISGRRLSLEDNDGNRAFDVKVHHPDDLAA